MEATTALICPKCQGKMRTYERNGVTVDQCEDCRGIFLDRGELERLIDLEGGGSAPERGHDDRDRHREDDRHESHHGHGHHDERDDYGEGRHGRRRTSATSFLGDLLGGGGD